MPAHNYLYVIVEKNKAELEIESKMPFSQSRYFLLYSDVLFSLTK